MGYRVFMLILMAIYLFYDYKKDKGLFTLPKVLHTIIVTYFTFYYSNAFVYIGYLIGQTSKVIAKYNRSIGIFSNEVNLLFWFLHIIISCFIIYAISGMWSRKDKSRRLLLNVLPYTLITEPFSFYRGFADEVGDDILNPYLILSIGAVITIILNGVVYWLYSNWIMKEFFNRLPIEESAII